MAILVKLRHKNLPSNDIMDSLTVSEQWDGGSEFHNETDCNIGMLNKVVQLQSISLTSTNVTPWSIQTDLSWISLMQVHPSVIDTYFDLSCLNLDVIHLELILCSN